MDSQEKLKNMENKILALGQENNVVKNLAEIIKSKKNDYFDIFFLVIKIILNNIVSNLNQVYNKIKNE